MHANRENLILWYLSIWQSDLGIKRIVATIRISRSFLWNVMKDFMHEMQLWFLGIWKGHFSHLPKLNYGCKIKCLHSIIALAWFFFELIFDYFWSKNLSLYQNTILAILITYRNSIDFGPLHQFGLVQSTSTHFCQFWPNLIYFSQFNPIWSIQSIKSTLVILVLFSPFCPIWSIRPTSVQFGLFGPFQSLQSIRSNLVHTIHLGLFGLIWSIQST